MNEYKSNFNIFKVSFLEAIVIGGLNKIFILSSRAQTKNEIGAQSFALIPDFLELARFIQHF